LFGEPLGKNRELSGVICESGKIGNYQDPIFPNNPDSGIIGNYRESVLAIINHVFACLQNIAVLSRCCHQLAIVARRVPQNTCVITSFLRATLRDVVTMFTFAIVSSNAWVQQCKTSSMKAPAKKPHMPNMPGSNS
jgi:hypothetical protein